MKHGRPLLLVRRGLLYAKGSLTEEKAPQSKEIKEKFFENIITKEESICSFENTHSFQQ
jgi:hypothetical protein